MYNINTNINHIIFTKDMELRKIKKKKKKKGPSKKKIALDNLKQVLQSFDAVINEAKEIFIAHRIIATGGAFTD